MTDTRGLRWIFAILLTAGAAEAQSTTAKAVATPERPRWDLTFSAGLFQARPEEADTEDYDNWYSEGRYASGLGYYWTENFKIELEVAHTPEGSRYVPEVLRVPGTGVVYPISVESFHRLQHGSIRLVWQFFDNTWVHPYVNGGFVFERERRRYHVPEFRAPPDPRVTTPPVPPMVVLSASEETTEYRGGATVGGGAKFYVSPNTYINTGMQVTYAKPATTVSFVAGFGFDF